MPLAIFTFSPLLIFDIAFAMIHYFHYFFQASRFDTLSLIAAFADIFIIPFRHY
jgi:hypothetical protein